MSPGSLSRRDVLRQLALAATSVAAGGFNLEAARVVHAFAAGERAQAGGYAPRFLTVHEFATVTRLAELVVPADAGGGSAVDAGAPEFIDLLCSENERLAEIYRNGIAWLDDAMRLRAGGARVDGARGDGARVDGTRGDGARVDGTRDYGARVDGGFVGAPAERQTAMLDALVAAERDGGAGDLEPGVRFFAWLRRMTVDAYYTSPIGIRDVGYQGNRVTSAYETPRPAVEFIDRLAEDLGL